MLAALGEIHQLLKLGIAGKQHDGTERRDVRYQQHFEEVAAAGSSLFQRVKEFLAASQNLFGSVNFNLAYRVFDFAFGVRLHVLMHYFLRASAADVAAAADDVVAERLNVQLRYVAQVFGGVHVVVRRGCGLQDQRVAQDAAQKQGGNRLGDGHAVFAVHVCNDSAGGTDGLVDERDGIARAERRDAVMVDDFLDYVVLHAFHRLLRLVVVNQNDLHVCFVQQVAFADGADDAVVVVHYRQAAGRAFRKQRADGLHRVACAYRADFFVCHCGDRRGVFDEHGGCSSGIMAGKDGNVVLARKLVQFLFYHIVLCNDDGADICFDAGALDVFAVAHNHYYVFALPLFQQPAEGRRVVVADHDGAVEVVVRVELHDGGCVQRLFNQVQACKKDVAALGIQQLVGVERKGVVVEQPLIRAVHVYDGNDGGVGADHLVHRLPQGHVLIDGIVFVVHVIFCLGNQVGQIDRRFYLEALENVFGLRRQFARACRNVFFFAQQVLEFRVGGGSNHGIGVRVAVPDDVNLVRHTGSIAHSWRIAKKAGKY